MDAPCKIQGSIHVFRLVNNMCPGKWVHIKSIYIVSGFFIEKELYIYSISVIEKNKKYNSF